MKNHIQFSKNNPQISSSATKEIKKAVTYKISSAISSFSQNHLKSSILKSSLKIKNKKGEKEGPISPRNKNRNLQQLKNNFSSKVLSAKQINIKENENIFNLNENQIDNNKFYKIRRETNKIIKDVCKSPYMVHLINKGNYKDSKVEYYPNYYNYYQICHLMDKKTFRLSLNYNEHLIFHDEQEYLMKYFDKNEQYIIMHYLLYKVYNRDRTVIADNPKKIMTDKQIKEMFKQLVKNNYQFDGNMEILDNIGVYFRMSFSNSGKIVLFLEKLQPVIRQSINFFYVKDMPKRLIPNCMPNLFPILKKKYKYLSVFLRLRKYNRSKKYGFYEEEKALREIEYDLKDSKNIKNKKNNMNLNTRNESEYKGRSSKSSNESNKVEENMLKNISLSSEKEKEKDDQEIIEPTKLKNHHNTNRRLLVDNDIYDLEVLLNKISPFFGGNIDYVRREKKRITIREDKKLFSLRDIKKMNANGKMEDNRKNSLYKIAEYQDNSLLENKKKIMENNRNYFKKVSKREIFQTGLKGPIAIKTSKNKLKRIKSSQQYFSRNEMKSSTNKSLSFKNIAKNRLYFKYGRDNHDNKIISKLKKSNIPTNQKKYYLKNTKSDFSSSDIQIPKVNISKNRKNFKDMTTVIYQKDIKNKIINQRNRNIFDFNNDGSGTNNKYDSSDNFFNININIPNNNNIYLRDSSKSVTQIENKENKFKDTKEFIENALLQKNKYTVKKFCSLKEFETLYDKIKAIGKLPKTRMFFHGNKYKGFSSTVFDFFKSKSSNGWEEQKEERSKIKDDYFLINMQNKLKKEEEKNKLLSKKFCSLKKLLKFPNIYS